MMAALYSGTGFRTQMLQISHGTGQSVWMGLSIAFLFLVDLQHLRLSAETCWEE